MPSLNKELNNLLIDIQTIRKLFFKGSFSLRHYSLSFLLLAILAAACDENSQHKFYKTQISGHTMGTTYHITLYDKEPIDSSNELRLSKEISGLLQVINLRMSTYLADSQISRFNRSTSLDWFPVASDVVTVVKAAKKISQQTKGAFDITVAPLVEAWGFGKTVNTKIPDTQALDKIKKYVGYQKLDYRDQPPALRKSHKDLQLDLSAIAKGFAVDKISQFLIKQKYANFMVEIGGELRTKGHSAEGRQWRIIIRNPHLEEEKIQQKTLLLKDKAVATSGNYINYFIKDKVRYSHILDPRTAQPKKQQAMSVTVLHESTMLADAYATALIVLGEQNGQKLADHLGLEVYWAK